MNAWSWGVVEPRNQQLKLKPINVHVGLLLPEASLEDQEVQSSHCIPPPGHRPPLDDRDVGARRPLPPRGQVHSRQPPGQVSSASKLGSAGP